MFGLAIMMHFWETAVGHKNWTTICTTHTQPLNLAKLIMYHTNCKTTGNSVEPWLVYIVNIHYETRFAGFPSSSGGADKIFIIPLSCLTTFVSKVF